MKKDDEQNSHIITVRVTEEKGLLIRKLAKKHHMFPSAFVRMLIIEGISKLGKEDKKVLK